MSKNKIMRRGRMYEPLVITALIGILIAVALPCIENIRTVIRTGVENDLDWVTIAGLVMFQLLLGIIIFFLFTVGVPLCLMGICFLVDYLNKQIQKRRR